MAAESPQIKTKIWHLFGREKPGHKVLGGAKPAGVFLWRINKIWPGLIVWQTTACDLFMLHGCVVLKQICHCFVTVLYLWPTKFISKWELLSFTFATGFEFYSLFCAFLFARIAPHISELLSNVLAVLREINRCFAEINRGLAEINRGVAVLRGVVQGRRLQKFVITLFLLYICILYFSSPPHIPQASVTPQASITKDLIVNITVYLRDKGGLVVRREFVCHIAIVLR